MTTSWVHAGYAQRIHFGLDAIDRVADVVKEVGGRRVMLVTTEGRRQSEAGERVVKAAQFPEEVATAVRHHHERWDGTGTPGGLAGDSIPIGSRILSVAEVFEAMTAGRGGERVAASEALKRVSEKVGSEFDGAIVDALGRSVDDGNMDAALPATALPASVSA